MPSSRNWAVGVPRSRGIALVAVLLLVAVLTLLASSLTAMTMEHRRQMERYYELVEDDVLNDSAIRLACIELLANSTAVTNQPRQLGVARAEALFGRTLNVTISSEFGRVDLNTGDPDFLLALFTSSGVPADSAQRLLSQITARRDRKRIDTVSSQEGSDSPFESVSQIRALPGGDTLPADVYDALTVYTQTASPVEHFAAPAVKQAFIWAQRNHVNGHAWLPDVPDAPRPPAQVSSSRDAPIRMTSCIEGASTHCRTAVIRLSGDERPVEVFYWGSTPP